MVWAGSTWEIWLEDHVADFASNCPVSRPIDTGWTSDWDLNGMQWSYDYGMFYAAQDDMAPLRKPAPRTGQ